MNEELILFDGRRRYDVVVTVSQNWNGVFGSARPSSGRTVLPTAGIQYDIKKLEILYSIFFFLSYKIFCILRRRSGVWWYQNPQQLTVAIDDNLR